jgi:hypothetical protein
MLEAVGEGLKLLDGNSRLGSKVLNLCEETCELDRRDRETHSPGVDQEA